MPFASSGYAVKGYKVGRMGCKITILGRANWPWQLCISAAMLNSYKKLVCIISYAHQKTDPRRANKVRDRRPTAIRNRVEVRNGNASQNAFVSGWPKKALLEENKSSFLWTRQVGTGGWFPRSVITREKRPFTLKTMLLLRRRHSKASLRRMKGN